MFFAKNQKSRDQSTPASTQNFKLFKKDIGGRAWGPHGAPILVIMLQIQGKIWLFASRSLKPYVLLWFGASMATKHKENYGLGGGIGQRPLK